MHHTDGSSVGTIVPARTKTGNVSIGAATETDLRRGGREGGSGRWEEGGE